MEQQQNDELIRNLLAEGDAPPVSFNKSLAWQRLEPRLPQLAGRRIPLRAGIAAMAACLAVIVMIGLKYLRTDTHQPPLPVVQNNVADSASHIITTAPYTHHEDAMHPPCVSNQSLASTKWKRKPRLHHRQMQTTLPATEICLLKTVAALPPAYFSGKIEEQPGYYTN